MSTAVLAVHVFFGTLAFGFGIAFDLLLVAVARTRRLETIGATYRAAQRYMPIGGLSFAIAILLGFAIAGFRHESLTSTWLLGTYACLVAAGAANGILVQRRGRRILAAIEASGGVMTDELNRLLSGVWPAGALIGAVAMLAVISLMLSKPA